MATIKFNSTLRTSIIQLIADSINAGTGTGYIEIYSGTQPSSPQVLVTNQVKLSTLTFSDPCGLVSTGTLTFSDITRDNTADNSGTATWARVFNADNVAVCDLDITDDLGTGAIKLDNIYIIQGMPILLNSMVIRLG